MKRATKYLEFDQKTRQIIWKREHGKCFFCSRNYHMNSTTQFGYQLAEVMHYIPRSKMGLGIEQNGVLGCDYHHGLLDNGNKGLRPEMLAMIKEYLQSFYPDWNEENLVYNKYKL